MLSGWWSAGWCCLQWFSRSTLRFTLPDPVAYSDFDKVSMNVGSITANAGGRLAGTVLSGWAYQTTRADCLPLVVDGLRGGSRVAVAKTPECDSSGRGSPAAER